MQVGAEDPRKIDKLVHSPGQLERFHALYFESALAPLLDSGVISSSGQSQASTPLNTNSLDQLNLAWNPRDPSVLKHLWQQLPPRFQRLQPSLDNSHSMVSNHDLQNIRQGLHRELHSIVAPAARYQSFKGLWTAGMTKSTKYALAKLSKGILRKQ